jgi:hypothetical protein
VNLENVLLDLENNGYYFNYNFKDKTIDTKRGRVKIIEHNGHGQPYCFLLKNEIHIFTDNTEILDDLIHEKTHFDIFPYDFISYNVGMASFIGTTLYNSSSNFNTVLLTILGASLYFNPLIFNLYSDFCVNFYRKIKETFTERFI